MSKLLKRLIFTLPLIIFALNANAYDNCDPCAPCDPDPCPEPRERCEEPCCDPCQERSENKLYDQGYQFCENHLPKAYNAPSRIDICDGWDTYVTGTFIYWEALGDYFQLGAVIPNFNVAVPSTNDVNPLDFKYKYEPGFKVGLGQNFNFDNWDIYATYTWFHTKNNFTFLPSSTLDVIFIPYLPTSFFVQDQFQAHWKRDLDKIDLELARSFYVGTHLSFRPFIGASGHWFDQKYDFVLNPANIPSGANYILGEIKADSWAIGPRFGMNTNWIISNGFKVFGNAAFNLMYVSNKFSGIVNEQIIINQNYRINKTTIKSLRHVDELMLGLGWGSYFANDKTHFEILAAYELQYYSHTNYFMEHIIDVTNVNVIENSKPGDLYLHGLTLSARFDF